MWEEAVSSWPIIPFSIAGALLVVAMAGLIAMLYDSGARDTGRMTCVGSLLLGIGITGCMCIGLWNMTVSIARLSAQQSALAVAAPMRE
jgi:uncharacterized membrane protein YiaA